MPIDSQPFELQLDDIEMPSVLHIRFTHRSFDFGQISKPLVIGFGNPLSRLKKSIASLELFNPETSGDVGKIVFVAGAEDFRNTKSLPRCTGSKRRD
jgi:hypothetical protein